MKQIYSILLVLAMMLIISSSHSYAQENKGHLYTVTTWKFKVPADGSNAELDSLAKVWHDKVVVKNDKIISEKVLRHYWGNDMRDWVYITEYASWGDIEAAGDEQNKLIEAAWPDETERHQFFETFRKYLVTHSDEIFMELPDLKK